MLSKKQPLSNISNTKSVSLDKKTVRKVWIRAATREQKLRLLRNLRRKKLGIAQIEVSIKDLEGSNEAPRGKTNKYLRGGKSNKSKNEEKAVKNLMESKVDDARRHARKAQREKVEVRKIITDTLGSNSRAAKNLIKYARKEAFKKVNQLKKKHDDKIKHLNDKFKKKDEEMMTIPAYLWRFRNLSDFSNQYQDENVRNGGDEGGGDNVDKVNHDNDEGGEVEVVVHDGDNEDVHGGENGDDAVPGTGGDDDNEDVHGGENGDDAVPGTDEGGEVDVVVHDGDNEDVHGGENGDDAVPGTVGDGDNEDVHGGENGDDAVPGTVGDGGDNVDDAVPGTVVEDQVTQENVDDAVTQDNGEDNVYDAVPGTGGDVDDQVTQENDVGDAVTQENGDGDNGNVHDGDSGYEAVPGTGGDVDDQVTQENGVDDAVTQENGDGDNGDVNGGDNGGDAVHVDGEVEEDNEEMDVLVVGVEIDDDERAALKLPPKFATYAKLEKENFELNVEIMNAKMRYSGTDDDNIFGEEFKMTDEEEFNANVVQAEVKEPYDPEWKTLNMTKRRVTDLKNNVRVHLPKPLVAREEADLAVRITNRSYLQLSSQGLWGKD